MKTAIRAGAILLAGLLVVLFGLLLWALATIGQRTPRRNERVITMASLPVMAPGDSSPEPEQPVQVSVEGPGAEAKAVEADFTQFWRDLYSFGALYGAVFTLAEVKALHKVAHRREEGATQQEGQV